MGVSFPVKRKEGALRAFPFIFRFRGRFPQHDATFTDGHEVKLQGHAFAVLVISGGPDAGPEGFFSAFGYIPGNERRWLLGGSLGGSALSFSVRHDVFSFG